MSVPVRTPGGLAEPVISLACAKHGPMRFRLNLGWWDCAGFDGEGCAARVTCTELCVILAGRPLDPCEFGWKSYHYRDVDTLEHVDVRIYGPNLQRQP